MSSTSTSKQDNTKKDNWTTERYSSNASFVYSSKFTSAIVDLLAPQSGERILDLGCGHGALTLECLLPAVLPQGSIIGLDSSSSLLSTARSSTSQLPSGQQSKIEWIEMDAHDLRDAKDKIKDESIDAVFSSAALHWMKEDPKKVLEGTYRVLKSGGRFAGEMGGFLTVGGVRGVLHLVLRQRGYDPASIDPWFFPTPEHYQELLEGVGYRVESCELIPRPTSLPTGLEGWLETFAFPFFAVLKSPEEQSEVIKEVCKLCEVDMKDERSGEWMAMYVRSRFKAWKD